MEKIHDTYKPIISRRLFLKSLGQATLIGATIAAGIGPSATTFANDKDLPPITQTIIDKTYKELSPEEDRLRVLRSLHGSPVYQILGDRLSDVTLTNDGTARVFFTAGAIELRLEDKQLQYQVAKLGLEMFRRRLDKKLGVDLGLPQTGVYKIIDNTNRPKAVLDKEFGITPNVVHFANSIRQDHGLDCGKLQGATRFSDGEERFRCEGLTFVKKGHALELFPLSESYFKYGLVPQEAIENEPMRDLEEAVFQYRDSSYDIIGLLEKFSREVPGATMQSTLGMVSCESHFNPRAGEGRAQGPSGMYQIMKSTRHVQIFVEKGHERGQVWNFDRDVLNPYRSTIAAIQIGKEETLRAWSCYGR